MQHLATFLIKTSGHTVSPVKSEFPTDEEDSHDGGRRRRSSFLVEQAASQPILVASFLSNSGERERVCDEGLTRLGGGELRYGKFNALNYGQDSLYSVQYCSSSMSKIHLEMFMDAVSSLRGVALQGAGG